MGSKTFVLRQSSLCFMFLMNADLPLIRFHVLKVENAQQSVLNVFDIKSICCMSEFHLRVWSAPTVSASLPEGWTDSDITEPLRKREDNWVHVSSSKKTTDTTTSVFVASLSAYLCALMDFRHCHFFVFHTHRRPSSPPLSK